MKALVLNAEGKTASVTSIPRPSQLAYGEVLVKVHSIALNPVDFFHLASPVSSSGRVIGSDFSGVIVDSNHTDLPLNQRVAGCLQGATTSTDRPGAFAEYIVCPADLLWRVPDSTTLEQAAAMNVNALTAAIGLFLKLGLQAPFPWDHEFEPDFMKDQVPAADPKEPLRIFIHGASSSVGLYAAQLARRSAEASGRGLLLVGTASQKNHKLLQSVPYAYDYLLDYHEDEWATRARSLTPDGFDAVLDCISEGPSVRDSASLLRPDARPGTVIVILTKLQGGWGDYVRDVPAGLIRYIIGWQGLGVEIDYDEYILPASPQTRAFSAAFYNWLSTGQNTLEANPIRLMPGGLENVVSDGFILMGPGGMTNRKELNQSDPWLRPVSAEKIVYTPFSEIQK